MRARERVNGPVITMFTGHCTDRRKAGADDLHAAPRFDTSAVGKAMRNAFGDCGPVVSLNRRAGSNPLRRRLFRPMTV